MRRRPPLIKQQRMTLNSCSLNFHLSSSGIVAMHHYKYLEKLKTRILFLFLLMEQGFTT